jgi:predicted GH43/DUF377 family glycosyl hydrolase
MSTARRATILILAAGMAIAAAGRLNADSLPPLQDAMAPKGVTDATEATGVPAWGLGPFIRCPDNPLIVPRADTTFLCPILKEEVHWEQKNIVGAAAAVKDGKVYWLYRAEPNNIHNSRVGLGISADGIHFDCLPTPVLYPDNDAFKAYEWPGGTEDGRLVMRADGLYIYLYCSYNGRNARQSAATSRDLIHWTKQGPVFQKAYGGKYVDQIYKGGSIVCRYYDDGRVVPERIRGKYWMYCITYTVAYSDDCISWTPVIDAKGRPIRVLPSRRGGGKFDCNLIEPGPPPIMTPKGILVIYHGGENDPKHGDPNLPLRNYAGGQALFDPQDPTKLIARCDNYFLTPRTPYELNSSVGAPVCFMEGLVRFQGRWLLYYEAGDHVGAMASCTQPGFEAPPASR